MNILTERRRWWIAGITLTVSLIILIFGEKPSRTQVSGEYGSAPADTVPAAGN